MSLSLTFITSSQTRWLMSGLWLWENALSSQTAFLRFGKEKPTLRSLVPYSP